jgi:CRISPR-associated protein Cas5d
MREHEVQLEISGQAAMWTRPDTGDAPVSYPVPTFGAVKGVFESILWDKAAEIVPTKVEICRPIFFQPYTTNYHGPLRKRDTSNYQLLATILVDVCYRLYANVVCDHEKGAFRDEKGNLITTNGAHAYAARFERRLKQGKMFSMPCLGWKEFVPDYIGPFRDNTTVENIDLCIPSMLKTCFPHGKNSEYEPVYFQNIRIEKGVMTYAE